jgi:hypothetical protein
LYDRLDAIEASVAQLAAIDQRIAHLESMSAAGAAVDERLAALADIRGALADAKRGPIKLVNRDSAGYIDSIEEYLPEGATDD